MTSADRREVTRLLDQLERAYAGDAWHGTPVRAMLEDVDARLASARPVAGAAPTFAAWAATLDALTGAHERLAAAVGRLDEDLDGPVPGKSYTKYVLVHGVLQHELYHAGQIGLLKRAARP